MTVTSDRENGSRVLSLLGYMLVIAGIAVITWPFSTNLVTPKPEGAVPMNIEELSSPSPRWSAAFVNPWFDTSLRLVTGTGSNGDALRSPFALIVPKLGLNVTVDVGISDEDLLDGIGYYRFGAYPGDLGTCYVVGHRNVYGAPFKHLDRLEPGDTVAAQTPLGRWIFRVTESRICLPADIELDNNTEIRRMVLITCHPYWSAKHRLVVVADEADEQPESTPAGQAVEISYADMSDDSRWRNPLVDEVRALIPVQEGQDSHAVDQ